MNSISLLHATHRSRVNPLVLRDMWLSNADQPNSIEYIFAMDADDHQSILATESALRCIPGESGSYSTAVRNWNAAAQLSTRDVLFVIADDLLPSPHWDTLLMRILIGLDPRHQAFAVKIRDSPDPGDALMRHPIVSRAFYEQHGLFNPSFNGVYCDNDITLRAFWECVLIDGRSVPFEHSHPAIDHDVVASESHARMNRSEEYQHGESVLLGLWARWKIEAGARPIQPGREILPHPALLRLRAYVWSALVLSSIKFPVRRKVLMLRDRAVESRLYQRIRLTGVS